LNASSVAAQAGAGAIQFSSVDGRTVLTRKAATSPLRILNPRNAGTAAWAYLATFGGGLVGGDEVRIDIAVAPGAHALVATQASTKVYRSEKGAAQRLRADVGRDSLLALLPDPVTCFAGARYTQEQRICLEASANLVFVDWLTAGRIASGERWQFHGYRSRTFLWRADRLIWHDALTLDPGDGDVPDRMGRFNCLAVAVATGPAFETTAARLVGAIGSAPATRRADMLLSAAPLDDEGVVLRVAGSSTEAVAETLRQHLNIVPSLLGDDPWSRKW
jgi:urease accessory protein